MKIWICIPVFNRVELTIKCLATLQTQTWKNFSVVVCDHGSTDNTTEQIKQNFPEVVVLNADSRLWWTGAINKCLCYALEHTASNDYILTLNNDTELPPNYLAELVTASIQYPHSVLTSVIHDIATGNLSSVGHRQSWVIAKSTPVTFEKNHLPGDTNVISVTHASGRGTIFPREVFRKIGIFDQKHLPHYGADYDFSHKARRAGFPIYVCKTCRVFSHIDATGMTMVRDKLSLKGFVLYFSSKKSPANLKVRWWYGWNNCPKALFPSYILLDLLRIVGSYFRHFIFAKR